jgi:hypothetical protein
MLERLGLSTQNFSFLTGTILVMNSLIPYMLSTDPDHRIRTMIKVLDKVPEPFQSRNSVLIVLCGCTDYNSFFFSKKKKKTKQKK